MEKVIKKTDVNKILTYALDIGENMLKCNAEISRVEDTITRICEKYDIKKVDVFAIKTLIITTIRDCNEESYTQTRRIYSATTNLQKLEELNSISRYICTKKPSEEEIKDRLEKFYNTNFEYVKGNFIGYILSTTTFCIFFGGNFKDTIATGLIAILIFFVDRYIKKIFVNQIIFTIASATIMGWMAIIFVKLGIGTSVDKIIIGDIMLLIPGIHVINSMRDMLTGDILAGSLRLLDVVLISVSIACGTAIALLTLGGF